MLTSPLPRVVYLPAKEKQWVSNVPGGLISLREWKFPARLYASRFLRTLSTRLPWIVLLPQRAQVCGIHILFVAASRRRRIIYILRFNLISCQKLVALNVQLCELGHSPPLVKGCVAVGEDDDEDYDENCIELGYEVGVERPIRANLMQKVFTLVFAFTLWIVIL